MNDDTFVPISSAYWLKEMVRNMDGYSPRIGAIGPASNVVMGRQNIFAEPKIMKFEVPFLIGFCILIRREALDAAGGIDDTLPGGDDLDLSIRIRDAGYALVVRKDIFVWHYGFQTGERLNGSYDKPGGWNSREMTDNTNMGLIKKHGLSKWFDTLYPGMFNPIKEFTKGIVDTDMEGKYAREYIKGKKIIELGCGNKKTVPEAIGVDKVPGGEEVPNLYEKSVADIRADVEKELPFEENSVDTIIARHILEHCVDTISTLRNWIKILKPGGRLIIAVPDESSEITINLNPEHVHVFTPESLQTTLDLLGLKKIKVLVGYNTVSFLAVYEKE
jgi:SAM-dependent methyltransferase